MEKSVQQCEICNRRILVNELISHYFDHIDASDFPCQFCNKKYNKILYLKKHLQSYHKISCPYSCGVCKTNLTCIYELINHIQSLHSVEKIASSSASPVLNELKVNAPQFDVGAKLPSGLQIIPVSKVAKKPSPAVELPNLNQIKQNPLLEITPVSSGRELSVSSFKSIKNSKSSPSKLLISIIPAAKSKCKETSDKKNVRANVLPDVGKQMSLNCIPSSNSENAPTISTSSLISKNVSTTTTSISISKNVSNVSSSVKSFVDKDPIKIHKEMDKKVSPNSCVNKELSRSLNKNPNIMEKVFMPVRKLNTSVDKSTSSLVVKQNNSVLDQEQESMFNKESINYIKELSVKDPSAKVKQNLRIFKVNFPPNIENKKSKETSALEIKKIPCTLVPGSVTNSCNNNNSAVVFKVNQSEKNITESCNKKLYEKYAIEYGESKETKSKETSALEIKKIPCTLVPGSVINSCNNNNSAIVFKVNQSEKNITESCNKKSYEKDAIEYGEKNIISCKNNSTVKSYNRNNKHENHIAFESFDKNEKSCDEVVVAQSTSQIVLGKTQSMGSTLNSVKSSFMQSQNINKKCSKKNCNNICALVQNFIKLDDLKLLTKFVKKQKLRSINEYRKEFLYNPNSNKFKELKLISSAVTREDIYSYLPVIQAIKLPILLPTPNLQIEEKSSVETINVNITFSPTITIHKDSKNSTIPFTQKSNVNCNVSVPTMNNNVISDPEVFIQKSPLNNQLQNNQNPNKQYKLTGLVPLDNSPLKLISNDSSRNNQVKRPFRSKTDQIASVQIGCFRSGELIDTDLLKQSKRTYGKSEKEKIIEKLLMKYDEKEKLKEKKLLKKIEVSNRNLRKRKCKYLVGKKQNLLPQKIVKSNKLKTRKDRKVQSKAISSNDKDVNSNVNFQSTDLVSIKETHTVSCPCKSPTCNKPHSDIHTKSVKLSKDFNVNNKSNILNTTSSQDNISHKKCSSNKIGKVTVVLKNPLFQENKSLCANSSVIQANNQQNFKPVVRKTRYSRNETLSKKFFNEIVTYQGFDSKSNEISFPMLSKSQETNEKKNYTVENKFLAYSKEACHKPIIQRISSAVGILDNSSKSTTPKIKDFHLNKEKLSQQSNSKLQEHVIKPMDDSLSKLINPIVQDYCHIKEKRYRQQNNLKSQKRVAEPMEGNLAKNVKSQSSTAFNKSDSPFPQHASLIDVSMLIDAKRAWEIHQKAEGNLNRQLLIKDPSTQSIDLIMTEDDTYTINCPCGGIDCTGLPHCPKSDFGRPKSDFEFVLY